jgi:hypothetical protein
MININNKMEQHIRCHYGSEIALIIAAVAAVAAAGVSAYGAYEQGQAQKEMSKYNAEVARNNAKAINSQTDYDVQRIKDRNRRIRATQASGFLKSGVTLEGSAQDVLYDSSLEGEMDALSVAYKGTIQSNAAKSGAALYNMQGNIAQQNAAYSATGSILGGVGSAAGYTAQYNQYQAQNTQRNPSFKTGS